MSEHQPTSWSSFYFDLQVRKQSISKTIFKISNPKKNLMKKIELGTWSKIEQLVSLIPIDSQRFSATMTVHTLIADHAKRNFDKQQTCWTKVNFSSIDLFFFSFRNFTDFGIFIPSRFVFVFCQVNRCEYFHHFVRCDEYLFCWRDGSFNVSIGTGYVCHFWHNRFTSFIKIH